MLLKCPVKTCDLLIIGGGGSGAIAAIEASKHKRVNIILASKGPIGRSGLTPTANGGTAFHPSPEDTFKDIVTGGSFLSDQRLVWVMANEIEGAVDKLRRFGITPSRIRDISVCIQSGELLKKMRKKIIEATNIELMEDVLITRLLITEGHASGAAALNLQNGEFFVIKAKTVLVASGGFVGELYPNTSNNPFGVSTDSSGTGHAMAYLAGAELVDMEMIQFVPLPANQQCLHLRYFPDFWAGPYVNCHGEIVESHVEDYRGKSYSHLFVQKLYREIEKGNGPIYIDQRPLERRPSQVKIKSWSVRRRLIRKLGIEPHEKKIEIILGSHFGMGGIRVDEKCATTVQGLFAAGEVMGGVHGSLRMPGYSFSQMIVFGFKAGKQAVLYALEGGKQIKLSVEDVETEQERVFSFLREKKNAISLTDLKRRLQQVMADKVFVIRDKRGLEQALCDIRSIKADVSRLGVARFRRFNLEWARAIEFSLMVEVAEVTAASALARKESRGFHLRWDFPEQDDERWLRHTVASLKNKKLIIGTQPVELYRMKPETRL